MSIKNFPVRVKGCRWWGKERKRNIDIRNFVTDMGVSGETAEDERTWVLLVRKWSGEETLMSVWLSVWLLEENDDCS